MIDSSLYSIVLYPLLAGMTLALAGGPLGSFIVWQRLVNFGESMAHAAVLGVAIGIIFNTHSSISIFVTCCVMGFFLLRLQKMSPLAMNTLLAILAHTALAAGLVMVSLIPNYRIDLNALLFGDLLAVGQKEFLIIAGVVSLLFVFIVTQWKALVALIADEELAFVEGINTDRLKMLMIISLATIVAIGIKVVGILLITSLLIIPAATTRQLSRSPEQMAILASVVGLLAVLFGMMMSVYIDTPTGPSIVLVAGVLYFLVTVIGHYSKK